MPQPSPEFNPKKESRVPRIIARDIINFVYCSYDDRTGFVALQ